MPTVITQGAASAKGYGFGARATAANYIEDGFSTYLYTGTGVNQTITNGIDLSTKGGMVWIKSRTTAANNGMFDTARGANKRIQTDGTGVQTTDTNGLDAFNTNGFLLGTGANEGKTNTSSVSYVSWTFRKQAKFFDVVTYTGNGTNRTIAHNLGSVPGCIMVKCTSTASDWQVYHRSLANTEYMVLNSGAAKATGATRWNGTTPTSTVFSLGISGNVNNNGDTYVAYLFAHDAGGFGATGTDNVISCGSFTTDGSGNATVTLGYEPQWVMMKASSATSNWFMVDNMRGMPVSNDAINLFANTSGAETSTGAMNAQPLSDGFKCTAGTASSTTYIYIAIRRGPMKTPTVGTSVFYPIAQTGNANNTSVGFSPDWTPLKVRNGVGNWFAYDRLRGLNASLSFNLTNAESTVTNVIDGWLMNGVDFGSSVGASDQIYVPCFRRAPGFFDVVCYTGTGVARTVSHNLGAVPELMIVKDRGGSGAGNDWAIYASSVGATGYLLLNTTGPARTVAQGYTKDPWNSTAPTGNVFSVKTDSSVNFNGFTYVAYLFATVAGVSKVGSYTGTGTTKQIDCGFTSGARFVLIKRTDSSGDWYVWDSARGIVAGNDSYLLLNSTAAEVTSTDYIDTYSAGFEISSTAPAAINANGGTFIFLAIA